MINEQDGKMVENSQEKRGKSADAKNSRFSFKNPPIFPGFLPVKKTS